MSPKGPGRPPVGKPIMIRLQPELLDKIDRARWPYTRAAWIREACRYYLAAQRALNEETE